MNEPGEGDRDLRPRVCVCGKTLPTVAGQAAEDSIICPHCGSLITASAEESSLAETQMINVAEMARMAQDGLSEKVSRDLDAPEPDGSAAKKDPGSNT